jgi:hypothetical protein
MSKVPRPELAPLHIEMLIRQLLTVHALTNLYLGNGNWETLEQARQWLPTIRRSVDQLTWSLPPKEPRDE